MSTEEGITAGPAVADAAKPSPDGPPVAVSIRKVSKRFTIPHDRVDTLKQRVIQPRRNGSTTLEALREIDFDIRVGEFFGIVGRNGSGKSTLLKLMGGIYTPDEGEIAARGRLATFIELGVGFNPELSARDNIALNASLLGLSVEQVAQRFDEIVAFAELEDYIDMKLKNFSSGMHVRLAFSVAMHVDSDVLLIDEVLAVGDAAFQQKCFDTFERFREEGRTIVFVTHDMALVERFCTRALMLEDGDIVAFGNPTEVAVEYMRSNFDQIAAEASGPASEHERIGDGSATVTGMRVMNDEAVSVDRFRQGERSTLRVSVRFNKPMNNPILALSIRDHEKRTVFFASTLLSGARTGSFEAGDTVDYDVRFTNHLEDGRYLVSPSVVHDGNIHVADMIHDIASFLVSGRRGATGSVNLPHEIEVKR